MMPVEPPPPVRPGPQRVVFDGSFVGPLAPPRPMARSLGSLPPPPPPPPVVPEVISTLPLGTGRIVAMSLDLLTRQDAGIRSASFYIGLLLLVSAGPVLALLAVGYLVIGGDAFSPRGGADAYLGWSFIAGIPAFLGYLAMSIESSVLAVAVIGGRAEGRPLRLRESIAISRRRFWPVFGGQIVAGIVVTIAGWAATTLVDALLGSVASIDYGVQLIVGLVVGAPFVYTTAGIVLGEVRVTEALGRSIRLFRARKRLALVVSVFGAFSQFIVLFGVSIGLDTTDRLGIATGLLDRLPVPLVVPVIAALVFALGTLTFLVAAIAAAPAVYAFAALTHYTHGLEVGRQTPLAVRRTWDPWFTRPMALGAIVALVALIVGVLTLPTG